MNHDQAATALRNYFELGWDSRSKIIWPNISADEAERPEATSTAGTVTIDVSELQLTMTGAFSRLNELDVFELSGTAGYDRKWTISQRLSADSVKVFDHGHLGADETVSATLSSFNTYVTYSFIADSDEQAWQTTIEGFRNNCIIAVQIFTPHGQGPAGLWPLADTVKQLFRGRSIAGALHFGAGVSYSPPLRSGRYSQVTVSCPLHFYEGTLPDAGFFDPDFFDPGFFDTVQ